MRKVLVALIVVIGFTNLVLIFGAYFNRLTSNEPHLQESAVSKVEPINLDNFIQQIPEYEARTDVIYDSLTPRQRVAQLVISGLGNGYQLDQLEQNIVNNNIGGFMYFGGLASADLSSRLQELAPTKLGLIVAIDAEPSLIANRLPQLAPFPDTANLKTPAEASKAARTIADNLNGLGINTNFAPVYDNNINQSVIGNRSFGLEEEQITVLAGAFIEATQEHNVAATSKHFPGHGSVDGDTHNQLQTITGELTELPTFKSAINSGTALVMVGHLAVADNKNYDTAGMPATLSSVIMRDLLRNELDFRGVIITDSMQMSAVNSYPDADLLALKAGADIVLLPDNPAQLVEQIISQTEEDEEFAQDIEQKIRRIIKLKLALSLNSD